MPKIGGAWTGFVNGNSDEVPGVIQGVVGSGSGLDLSMATVMKSLVSFKELWVVTRGAPLLLSVLASRTPFQVDNMRAFKGVKPTWELSSILGKQGVKIQKRGSTI